MEGDVVFITVMKLCGLRGVINLLSSTFIQKIAKALCYSVTVE